jgi:ATP-dependent DNA helicase RecQ
VIPPGLAQATLDAWADGASFAVTSRFASALSTIGPDASTGAADVAVLVRQCLRADDEHRLALTTDRDSFVRAWLEVPICPLFPGSFEWMSYGLLPQGGGAQRVRITAEAWRPEWLDVPDGMSVDGDSAAGVSCRTDESVQGDPFLRAIDTSFSTYKTPGQRASVRSAMVLPAGATLVVNLPTGAGKTLAMLAAAETASLGMTSVIVVPTVALALDQERRYCSQNPDSPGTAYHGGLSDTAKKGFRERLWSGEQRVVFTNPEAVVSSLARPLAEAAGGGRLALLGVDEAHVVGSWGDAFRPHFHSLAGLRRFMLREAKRAGHPPFKTILASATLTEDVLTLLRALFGEPGPFLQVAAPVLRPEPSYWQATDLEPVAREAHLLETLRHVPRPAVVYTTLRQEQRPGTLTPTRIAELLRGAGYRRLEIVDGGSSTIQREKVLRELRAEGEMQSKIDLVVATSAFGLGIDVPDIRSVVHACVPEGIDRFYQEVGRGGRDGNASTSVLVATPGDEDVAQGLASPTYLTSERARERWTAMMLASRDVGDELRRLPLTATSGKVKVHGDYNERWNLFTVILLARAGAVEWDFSFSGHDDDGELESDIGWLTVRLVRGDHQTDQFWRDVVDPTRLSMVENSRKGLLRLRSAMNGTVCTGVLIAESFTIDEPPELRTTCLVACGGCRWCRAHEKPRWTSPSPIPAAIAVVPDGRPSLDRLAVRGLYGRRVAIYLDPSIYSNPRKLRGLLPRLVSAAGVGLIVAGGSLVETVRDVVAKSQGLVQSVMVDSLRDFDPITAVGVPTLILLSEGEDADEWLDGNSRAPLTVICAAPDSPVGRSGLTVIDQDGSYSLADIEELQ